MFWRFGGHASISSLDQVLDKPGVTLEDLLEESDLIQELKQQNSKLIGFLREDDVLQKLLQYAIAADSLTPTSSPPHASPPPSADQDVSTDLGFFGKVNPRSRSKSLDKDSDDQKQDAQRRKYAYMACEILSSEVWSITEALLADPDHLRQFWEFLRRPAPLDPLQAGYFTKINETLLDKKTEDMFAFLQTLDAPIPEMLKHVDCPTIMDLLLKMVSMEKHDGGQGIVDWLQSQGLLLTLLSYLSPDNPPSYQTSAGDFLKAIITISANATAQDQTVIGPNELTRQLVSHKCVSQLIGYMLHGGNPLTVGVGIVIEVIRKNNSDYDGEFEPGPEPRTSDPIYLGTLLRAFSENIGHFMNLVRCPAASKPNLKTAFGARVEPLGFDRFKTCELMAELLHCSNMGLLNERGSDADLTARDAERQRLKTEGKLAGPVKPNFDDPSDPYGSSVDSHGFHHAKLPPSDDLNVSPVAMSRLEIQNASDEDGFEKLAVPEAEPLPDEVSFDDLMDNMQEPAARVSETETSCEDTSFSNASAQATEGVRRLDLTSTDSSTADLSTQVARRVTSLTERIQEEIEGTAHPVEDDKAVVKAAEESAARHPEDKPAPLFARQNGSQPGDDPILGPSEATTEFDGESPSVDDQSINTLLAETDEPSKYGDPEADDSLYERDIDDSPVVGDVLKMQFVEHQVVPTILDFFFQFPWNNFLHNVVYDVVQQVFNGNMERGYNRQLARDLFQAATCPDLESRADVVHRILDGQQASEKSQSEKGMRLGYMGHLTLIAEEVCKFGDRHSPEFLGDEIMQRITCDEWTRYVNGTLTETRERDNAVLGGVRPDAAGIMRPGGGGGGAGVALLGPVSLLTNSGNSSALADAGLGGGSPINELSLSDPEPSQYDVEPRSSDMLTGLGKGEDDDDDEMDSEESHRRAMALDDDEQQQQSQSPTTTEVSPIDPSSPNGGEKRLPTAPPPLNIPPSRARKQLAARLALRKRAETDATAAEQDQSPTSDAPTSPRSNEGPSSPPAARSALSKLFSASSGGSSSNALVELDDSEDDSGNEEVSPRRRRRTPSTTEAKVRVSIDDEETARADVSVREVEEDDSSSDGDIVEIRPRRTGTF